jgi:WD40 repeat protein
MEAVQRALQRIQNKQTPLPLRGLLARHPPQHPSYAFQQSPFAGGTGGQILQSLGKRGISRRTAIIGLVGLAGLATLGSGLTLPALIHDLQDLHLLYTYHGHSLNVSAVAWSPDGRRIASGSWDKTVQVWDSSTGRKILTYQGHSVSVNAVAWSPIGRRIDSGSQDTTVQV